MSTSHSSSPARLVYREVLAGPIRSFLAPKGFAKKGLDSFFNRDEANHCTRSIHFQLVWGDTDSAEVDVYARIGWDKLREYYDWWFGSPDAEAGFAQFGENLRNLDPRRTLPGIKVVDAAGLAEELLDAVSNHVIPLLERFSDIHQAIEVWEAETSNEAPYGAPFGAPLARLSIGDRAGAIASATRYLKEYEARGDFRNVERHERLLEFIRQGG